MVGSRDYAVCLVQPTVFPEASRVDIYEYSRNLAVLGLETHAVVSQDRAGPLPERLHVHALGFAPGNTPYAWWRFASRARDAVRRLQASSRLRVIHLFNPSPATFILGALLRREPSSTAIVYDLRTGGLGRGADAWLIRRMARRAPAFADAVIALTPELGSDLLGHGAAVRHVPLGVDLDAFKDDARAAKPQGATYSFLYAGTLSRNRCLATMLEAFGQVLATHPHARLVIAGDGDDRGRLERIAGRPALRGAVRFLGKTPFQDIPAHYRAADCGLAYLPNKPWFQPQPQLKTLECFACNLPLVAVATAGNRQLWDGLPGELLTGDDAESFASGMRYAIEHAAELRGVYFRRVAQAHSWQRITRERLLPLYDELAAAPRS